MHGERTDTYAVDAAGARLATDVHLPARLPANGVPTLLLRTPYGRRGEVDRVAELAEAATSAGYALVAQDVRGRGESTGSAQPFVHEAPDGARTVEWVSEQSWSDRQVIPVGDSYCGYTACAAAVSGDPAVPFAVARVTSVRPVEEWLQRSGVVRLDVALPWLDFAFGAGRWAGSRPEWSTKRPVELAETLSDELRDVCLAAEVGDPWDLASRIDPRSIPVPVLHWTGWWDCLGRGQLADFRRRLGVERGRAGDGLIVEATDHEFHTLMRNAGTAEQAALVVEQTDRCRHALLAGATTLERRIVSARTGSHAPPVAGAPTRLYLRDGAHAHLGPEGGVISARPDALASGVAWLDDPGDPVPSQEDWVWGALRDGLPDETRVQVRPDVVTFSRGEQRHPELLAGRVRLRLPAGTRREPWHLVATLSDVALDGSASRIADGVALVPSTAAAGSEWAHVEVDLGTASYQLRAGHRLRLALAASSFPRYPVTPRRSRSWWLDEPPSAAEARVTIGPASFLEIEPDAALTAVEGAV